MASDPQTPDTNQPSTPDSPKEKSEFKFYRSTIAGLSIVLGKPESGEVEVPRIRFSPFEEKEDGERIKVGYLKTKDKAAFARLKSDPHVTEISEEEYDKCTDLSSSNVKPLPL